MSRMRHFRLFFSTQFNYGKNSPFAKPKPPSKITIAFLSAFPITTFCLGTWQVYRKQWKEDLIKNINEKIKLEPLEISKLFSDIQNLDQYEYSPFKLKGKFLYDREMIMGPRSRLDKAKRSSSSIISSQNTNSGYNVISAFKIADLNEVVLINRGWIPLDAVKSRTQNEELIHEDVEIIGILRKEEKRPYFHKSESNPSIWSYRDISNMSTYAHTLPLYFDLATDLHAKNSPIPNQTRVSLHNEHLSYIITWYGLSFLSAVMWYFNCFV